MKKIMLILLAAFLISACARIAYNIPYTPNPATISNPIETIKRTIERQPPDISYLPAIVEVDNEVIKLFWAEPLKYQNEIIGAGASALYETDETPIAPELVYYKNIGKMKIKKPIGTKVWRVEINDTEGNYLYWVYTTEKHDAEKFMDALTFMMNDLAGE